MYVSAEKSIAPRAITDGQEDSNGRKEESQLATLDLLSTGGDKSWALASAPAPDEEGKFWEVTDKVYTVAPWLTSAGNQTMALITNKGDITLPSIVTTDENFLFGAKGTEKEDIKKLSTDATFVMTSPRENKDVVDDKDANTVKDGKANVFKFNLERVVAQGMVAKAKGLTEETKDGKGTIDLTSLKYSAVNGAVQTYLFANNAGERTMTEEDGQYKDFKSAIDSYDKFKDAQDANAVSDKLIRLGNLLNGQTGNDALGNYKAIAVAESTDVAKETRGIYFLENSVDKKVFTKENKDYGFYRMAYAKVYAQYTPKEVYTWVEATSTMKTKTIEAGTTFYKGVKDNLLYDSKASAAKSIIAKDQKAYTYTEGMCAYRALWNRQVDVETGKLVKNADVRRNNIYLLTIKEFQGIGMPWDPSDPDDPNLPKPKDDPEEDPDNPDIEESETYMRVEAAVLPWNLVTRDVNLK